MNQMKHIAIFAALAAPMLAFAGVTDTLASIENSSGLFTSLSLWSMLIVAFVTSMMVWVGGRKMHGGVLGSVLAYFSVGMTVVFLAVATDVPALDRVFAPYTGLIHNALFTIGYVVMGIAASKLLNVIKGE